MLPTLVILVAISLGPLGIGHIAQPDYGVGYENPGEPTIATPGWSDDLLNSPSTTEYDGIPSNESKEIPPNPGDQC
jgi:hypothetical protein